jgi:hypothetical protein
LVLVNDRQRSDDALESSGNPGRGEGAVSEELGCLGSPIEEIGRGGKRADKKRLKTGRSEL